MRSRKLRPYFGFQVTMTAEHDAVADTGERLIERVNRYEMQDGPKACPLRVHHMAVDASPG
ncbi:MAG: hypothetical protein F4181_02750 [Proteobacteria bacterium]|nr:hypothetical protein [Pseudomonadota bacterium]